MVSSILNVKIKMLIATHTTKKKYAAEYAFLDFKSNVTRLG